MADSKAIRVEAVRKALYEDPTLSAGGELVWAVRPTRTGVLLTNVDWVSTIEILRERVEGRTVKT
jgi:hypothetical protein